MRAGPVLSRDKPLQWVAVFNHHTALQYIAARMLAKFIGVTCGIKTLYPKIVVLSGDAEMALSLVYRDMHHAWRLQNAYKRPK